MRKATIIVFASALLLAVPGFAAAQSADSLARTMVHGKTSLFGGGKSNGRGGNGGESTVKVISTPAPAASAAKVGGPALARSLLGAAVVAPVDGAFKQVGTVEDFIVGEDGRVSGAVVGVEGGKRIAVSWQALRRTENRGRVQFVTSMTPAQISAAPAYERPSQ
jgi:hypothetical protein